MKYLVMNPLKFNIANKFYFQIHICKKNRCFLLKKATKKIPIRFQIQRYNL